MEVIQVLIGRPGLKIKGEEESFLFGDSLLEPFKRRMNQIFQKRRMEEC